MLKAAQLEPTPKRLDGSARGSAPARASTNHACFAYAHALTGAPAAASWLPNRFDVMVTTSDGRLWDCGENPNPWGCSEWTPPVNVTFSTQSPGIAQLGDQRLLVAARGNDGQAYLKEWDWGQGTGGWIASGGWLSGGVALGNMDQGP